MARPKLLKIRLIYSVDDSPVPLELDLDPKRTTSLFLDEHATVEILGGFYESQGKTITRDQAIARFGSRAGAWFPKGKDSLPLNKAFMKKVWGQGEKKGTARGAKDLAFARAGVKGAEGLPVMVGKDPSCEPYGCP